MTPAAAAGRRPNTYPPPPLALFHHLRIAPTTLIPHPRAALCSRSRLLVSASPTRTSIHPPCCQHEEESYHTLIHLCTPALHTRRAHARRTTCTTIASHTLMSRVGGPRLYQITISFFTAWTSIAHQHIAFFSFYHLFDLEFMHVHRIVIAASICTSLSCCLFLLYSYRHALGLDTPPTRLSYPVPLRAAARTTLCFAFL